MKIKVKMKPAAQIVKRLGLDEKGDVQNHFTKIVSHRMTRYMPFRTGALSTKLKRIKSPTEIEVQGPYAHYQYEGEIWGPNIPKKENGVIDGYWSPKIKYPTGRKLDQSKGKNDRSGSHWEKRVMAEEGKAIVADLQRYIDSKK